MTKELAGELIKRYELVIKRTKRWFIPFWMVKQIIQCNCMDFGICNYLALIFPTSDYDLEWIKSFISKDKSVYWFSSCPAKKRTKKDMINQLQLRVDRLKTFPS